MELVTEKRKMNGLISCVNEKVEQAIDLEFSLPDYCPKIEKIIKCRLKPHISNLSYSSNTVTADGEATLSLLYCTKNSTLFGYETEVQFSKGTDIQNDCDRAMINAKADVEYVNCRAVNERKLSVHGAISIVFYGICNKENEIICKSDDNMLQMLKKEVNTISLCSFSSKQVIVDERLDIASASESIENIIKTDCQIHVNECKFVAGKAVVKAELCVNALYLNASNICECFKSVIPIEQMIDADSVDDECINKVTATICSFKLKSYTDINGECRSIDVNAKLSIDIYSLKEEKNEYIKDCYSLKNELLIDKNTVDNVSGAYKVDEAKSVKHILEFDGNALKNVIDVSCEVANVGYTYDDERITAKGIIAVCVVAQNESDEYVSYEKNIDFEHEFNTNGKNLSTDLCCDVAGCSYNIKSLNELEMRVKICICGIAFCHERLSVVNGIEVDENKTVDTTDMPAVVLYFAKKGESIWDIAMRYKTGCDLICEANGINSEAVESDRVLMIPAM